MRISRRAERVEPFHAMAFGARAAELEAEGHRVIRLGLGEPDFGAPPTVREAMRAAMDGRPLPYTPALGLPALRAAIAGFYRDRHGVDVDPRRIAVTSGASAALLVTLAAIADEGDEVLLADPSYPCNRQLIETFGARAVTLAAPAAARYQLDAAAVADAWTPRTRAVMIATPANPTGTTIRPDELAAICAFARERGAWRLVDEIYLDLADEGEDGLRPRTVLAHDPDAIVVSSFSKYFGMTGWRLGWCVLPEELVAPVERLAMNYFLCASTPAQVAALACFTPETLAVCEDRRAELRARREIALAGLAELGLSVPVPPDGAFYVYADVSSTGMDAWEFCRRALEEAHVSLTPGRDFGAATAQTHVRLSYTASREELREGLARLRALLA
ncbi:aminotransferase class I/II-fold pyridoxal phosphate-dependent enzyme [Microbacterium sp. JZ37]|uniref:aminotransferase class I/II-fold pyridoxal phosphate-dependent enzyme n=1 Tax=Microbacterium sp. JZ37 TaxID=2654193 RepID=UPI002B45CF7B|nr:aminotransferase class I/II-fold pyridoxal phosphate-dependent enzyme [Microbacterium sp. JZ37]WRH17096.1 aminotransferase class I/II-fold pyridoxal phosphate-dependent enzyme [Microbacterium sp. JZ37]